MTPLARSLLLSAAGALSAGAIQAQEANATARDANSGSISTSIPVAPLPAPISNNAVALITIEGEQRLYSFLGLGPGKHWQDISRAAYAWSPSQRSWRTLAPVPVEQGRLASVAAVAGGHIYLFGGYTVAEDGHEVSTPEVLRFNPRDESWTPVNAIPTPVDDSVAMVLADRYIYLISGWHMDRNVDTVQVYDTQHDSWSQATPFPGDPLFGHAGALLGRTLVICDGVKLTVIEGKRDFAANDACWRGDIDADDPLQIAWRRIASHPGAPRYRMGAAKDSRQGRVLFAGGSENPYNYDGIGYDDRPAVGSTRVQAYSPDPDHWEELPPLPQATMDHRGMPEYDGRFYLIGGMRGDQTVSAQVLEYQVTGRSP